MKRTMCDGEVQELRVLEGPADCGNLFGYWKIGLVQAGQFAVVADGELTNGGFGPSIVCQTAFASREAAEGEMRSLADGGDRDRYEVLDGRGSPVLEVTGYDNALREASGRAVRRK